MYQNIYYFEFRYESFCFYTQRRVSYLQEFRLVKKFRSAYLLVFFSFIAQNWIHAGAYYQERDHKVHPASAQSQKCLFLDPDFQKKEI